MWFYLWDRRRSSKWYDGRRTTDDGTDRFGSENEDERGRFGFGDEDVDGGRVRLEKGAETGTETGSGSGTGRGRGQVREDRNTADKHNSMARTEIKLSRTKE